MGHAPGNKYASSSRTVMNPPYILLNTDCTIGTWGGGEGRGGEGRRGEGREAEASHHMRPQAPGLGLWWPIAHIFPTRGSIVAPTILSHSLCKAYL